MTASTSTTDNRSPTENSWPTNRGRWGEDDDRGTLNLITPQVRARAVAEARTGRTVSLALPVRPTPLVAGPAPTGQGSAAVQQAMMFTGSPSIAMAELLIITTHHPQLTHIDALTHTVVDGIVYPGVPLSERGDATGISKGSSSVFADGLITRGVLVDLAETEPLRADRGATAADIEAALERTGTEFLPGDALVVHGGWDPAKNTGGPFPGMTLDAVAWMHRHDVSLYLGDVGDARPPLDPGVRTPLHRIGIARMGMPLVDNIHPAELVQVCREEGRHSFMLVLAPQRIEGATGLPINPLAIF